MLRGESVFGHGDLMSMSERRLRNKMGVKSNVFITGRLYSSMDSSGLKHSKAGMIASITLAGSQEQIREDGSAYL